MAKRKRQRRRPAVPPPSVEPGPLPEATQPMAAASVKADSGARLQAQYAYVRRDLLRIAVTAILMFAFIFASQFLVY